ncbi:MAG: hypothetical protein HYV60_22570, partial [Planctomycetia bacterium]|nr:hypothetical protein [Planctomycetia bacterium]
VSTIAADDSIGEGPEGINLISFAFIGGDNAVANTAGPAPAGFDVVINAGNAAHAGSPDPGFAEVANTFVAAHSLRFSDCRYDTEQILRFISENTTGGEHSHRPAALPTAAACMASDEMMRHVAIESHSLFVVGFYEGETEL